MAEPAGASRPQVHTIPFHRAFGDALAAGLMRRLRGDPLALARATVLVPNRRSARTIRDAFVRRAEGGLLLPRLVPVGEEALDEALGPLFDPAGTVAPIPPAIDPLRRRMLLARLICEARGQAGRPVDGAEAIRLAAELARVRDQLLVERVRPERLADAVAEELSEHWQVSLAELRLVLDRWPAVLAETGAIELAERRDRLLAATARGWRTNPPAHPIIAAGITAPVPAVAELLGVVARLPRGLVVLPGLDCRMDDDCWDALGPHDPDPVTGRTRPALETHPQFGLKLLLDRMGVARGEVKLWRAPGWRGRGAARSRAINNLFAPPVLTHRWHALPAAERRLGGIAGAVFANPAAEAQAIAIALREAVETPGRTAALVTPDRALATRVSAHLRRWGIEADDSAGHPLSLTPAGTLLLALAEAAAEAFAPVPLLALLKHPLVAAGEGRLDWLAGARALDLALRGPRPPAGLHAIAPWLAADPKRARALGWWETVAPKLAPVADAVAGSRLPAILAALREGATVLAGDAAWGGADGRALAQLVADLEAHAPEGPAAIDAGALVPVLRALADEVAVRPPQGGHPRIFIWGLIEARLQHAHLMVLGSLNEGTWPALPAPDPWLAPPIRRALGLPGIERRIGVNAHDFASAMGCGRVLLTRARRGASGPTLASRFWLRLEAMTGGLPRAPRLERWAAAIDRADRHEPAGRPAPSPPPSARPASISVTEVDRLKADPFAFYARSVLGLSALDAVDADPGPAWRGTQVHRLLELWLREDGADPAKLRPRAEAMLDAEDAHALVRALWEPRLLAAVDWIAARMAADRAEGRVPIAAERRGMAAVAGVELTGIADRIDRLADGSLAIVDYKTGMPPANAAVAAGYAMQLGLLGLIARAGGFPEVEGEATAFEYWSLAKKDGAFGFSASPADDKARGAIPRDQFVDRARDSFAEAAALWLTGDEPFTAKLHPEYAPYADYDQLMRLDEWYGRE